MPTVRVDGIDIEVPAGATVLQACARPIHGLIRHFRPELERRILEKQGAALEAAE